MAESPQNREKTQWEEENLLVTSNFSFYHCVFKRDLLQTRKNQGLFRKGLNTGSIRLIQEGDVVSEQWSLTVGSGLLTVILSQMTVFQTGPN